MDHVAAVRPRTVLDVGAGYGKWGLLLREQLDWLAGRHDPSAWQADLTALEATAGFTSPLYGWVYDRVVHDDIVHHATLDIPYDLVVMGDVIEHLTKADGLAVLHRLLTVCRNVIVATPVDWFDQDIGGNPWERHRSLWGIADFRPWTFDYDVLGHTTIVACLAGRGATYPTSDDRALSEAAYRFGFMDHQGLAARLVKQAGRRLRRVRRPGP